MISYQRCILARVALTPIIALPIFDAELQCLFTKAEICLPLWRGGMEGGGVAVVATEQKWQRNSMRWREQN